MERITRTYQEVFADADSLIEDAIEEARKLTQSNRGELQRVRAKIGELDKKIGSMTRLLVDRDIDATAKRAVSRQVGELEAERERLQQAVAELANDANDNTGRLAGAVRQALWEAQESLATVATPTEMRDFIEQYVGPMVLKPNGDIARKQMAPADAEAMKRSIVCAQRCSSAANPKTRHMHAYWETICSGGSYILPLIFQHSRSRIGGASTFWTPAAWTCAAVWHRA